MIRKLLIITLLALAAVATADDTQTVLTSGGVVYTVDNSTRGELRLVRRSGEERESILVPTTQDDAIESQAQLLWDDASQTLFVVWHRSLDRVDQILINRLRKDGNWSDSFLIATGSSAKRAGLQVALTKAVADGKTATLVHAAWWSVNANPVAEYALVAFEDGQHISTIVEDLQVLAGSALSNFDNEPVREVLHPPLAMARAGAGAGVDVVFGAPNSTRLTRVVLNPRIRMDARLWKPSKGGGGGVTPRAGLMSANGNPLKVILSHGRIVLYAPDTKFRFVMYQNNQWTPERMIQLDAKLTKEQMVSELHRTVEQLELGDEPVQSVIE